MVVIEISDPANITAALYNDTGENAMETMSSTEQDSLANSLETDPTEERRGRLKRRRLSSHSPARAPSPSRGHERDSGSRHRHHHRKHHRPSSHSTSMTPPSTASAKKHRRRSDAEPDHTLRGRVRNRSGSRGRTQSPLFEDDGSSNELDVRSFRKRSAPPSRHRIEDRDENRGGIRRQRSYPNLYKEERRDSKGDEEAMHSIGRTHEGGVAA